MKKKSRNGMFLVQNNYLKPLLNFIETRPEASRFTFISEDSCTKDNFTFLFFTIKH
jgi:hypothetical protein